MVAVLTGKDTDLVEVSNNAVSVNLATVIDTVKQRLVDRGFTLAERLPAIDAQFTIFQSDDITKAQTAFRLLERDQHLAADPRAALPDRRGRRRPLPPAHPDRRRRSPSSLSMLLLGVALNAFREIYLDAVPTDQLPTEAAGRHLRHPRLLHPAQPPRRRWCCSSRSPSSPGSPARSGAPVALRRGTTRAIGCGPVRRRAGRARHRPVRRRARPYKTPIRVGVLGLALLVYVLRDHPTGGFALGLLVVAAVVLLIVELLARPPRPPPQPSPARRQQRPGPA